jgi:pimeloyl-ACP methyl ester carboxylesterase
MEPRSLRVTGATGLELHALEWSTEQTPLVLIHGFGNEAHIWDDFAPSVAPYYRVLALDLRGHGDSDHDPAGRYDYDNHVADFEAFAEELDLGRLVLVGHSFGGRISTLYAARHPERMAGLVIVDSAPELDRRGIVRIQMDVAESMEPSFTSPHQYEGLLAHNYPAATPDAIRRMARHGLRERKDGRYVLKMDTKLRGAGVERRSADQMAEHEKTTTAALWKALAKISCPTLVVRGAASDIVSADVAERMADEVLQRGQLAVVPLAGHSVMTDNPDGFRDAVTDFILGDE